MKLNKVLALALSGVMAVSMLAGCSGAPVNGEQEGEQGEVVVDANDISDGVASYIDDLPEYVTFNGDNNLTKALDYVVEVANVEDMFGGYFEGGLKIVEDWNDGENDLQDRLETAVDTTGVKVWNIGSVGILNGAEDNTVSIPDAKAAQLYVASGVIKGNALNTLVAESIEGLVKTYTYTIDENAGDNDVGLYNHNYTVSVSTSVKSIEGMSVTFVAVEVVRESVRH